MAMNSTASNSAFVESMLKKAKEKGPTRAESLHQNVDMKNIEEFVKNIGGIKNKRK